MKKYQIYNLNLEIEIKIQTIISEKRLLEIDYEREQHPILINISKVDEIFDLRANIHNLAFVGIK